MKKNEIQRIKKKETICISAEAIGPTYKRLRK